MDITRDYGAQRGRWPERGTGAQFHPPLRRRGCAPAKKVTTRNVENLQAESSLVALSDRGVFSAFIYHVERVHPGP